MKIFSREQLMQIDRRTIMEEPISEIDLMERASKALADWLITYYPPATRIAVFAGPGNNGGDAMAVARLLAGLNFPVDLYLPALGRKRSGASLINLERLKEIGYVPIVDLNNRTEFPDLTNYDLLLDGLYGYGLNRPLEGFACEVIDWINQSGVEVVSVDLPSGLLSEENSSNTGSIIRATYTLTLEFPKLSLFFSENGPFFGNWEVIPFGLSEKAIDETKTKLFFLDQESVSAILKRRKIFSHKGSYGHGLLLSGSKGKFGAAQLAAKGALRAGLGLLTTHLPEAGSTILQVALPESMTSIDPGKDFISELPDLDKYAALAAGPGIGTNLKTQEVVRQLIELARVPMVLDADALNILAQNPAWIKKLPFETILTPHPAEFDRLSGIVVKSDEERFFIAGQFAGSYGAVLILKGAYTRIFFPDGTTCFNSTGNPGMATGGSGDVLTGILLGLLCQGYSPREAALLGVYLHGKSADLRVGSSSEESLIAGEIADYLGDAFASLKWK
ncbi:MAG: NAD(P)H-hydrate dehydratase [Bacteroidetes bacterium]|nr:NAD(P)H-hydrate dehydratase [Bacteroidota bacterium]